MTTRIHLAVHQDAATPPTPATGYTTGEPFVTSDGVVHILQSDGTWLAASGGGGPQRSDVQIILPGAVTAGSNVAPPGLFVPRTITATDLYLGLGTAPSTGACEIHVHYPVSAADGSGAGGDFIVTAASGVATAHSSLTGTTVVLPSGIYLTINPITGNGAADANLALLGTTS